MQRQPYQLSGRVSPFAMLFVPFGALFVFWIGFLHGYATVHNPVFGVGSLLLALFLGYLNGWATAWIGRLGHCRNRIVLGSLGAFFATIGLYVSWSTALSISFNGMRLVSPLEVWSGISAPAHWFLMLFDVAQNGWPAHFHHRPQAPMLWLFWLVEWVLVAGLAGMRAAGCRRVYCEACHGWIEEPKSFYLAPPEEDAVDLEALGNVHWAYINQLEPVINVNLQTHVLVSVFQCPDCHKQGAMALDLGLPNTNVRRGMEVDYRPVVTLTPLTEDDLSAVAELEETQRARRAAAADAAPCSPWLSEAQLAAVDRRGGETL